MLQNSDSENSHNTWFSSVATGFFELSSINPPRYTSFSFTWELGASSGFEFLLVLLAGFPTATSFPGSEDVIGFFADEELAGTDEDRFIAVGLDFVTILSSSFCTLFAIFLEQLIKLEFLAQQVELKWLMLNRWRRLFHSSSVKFPWSVCLRVGFWCQCT